MKSSYFTVFFGLRIVFGIEAFASTAEFHYNCQVLNPDYMSSSCSSPMDQISRVSQRNTVEVDSDGKFILYEDASNNCNGNRALKEAKSGFAIYRTDCEWDGFVDILVDRRMLRGASDGLMILRTLGKSESWTFYTCGLRPAQAGSEIESTNNILSDKVGIGC